MKLNFGSQRAIILTLELHKLFLKVLENLVIIDSYHILERRFYKIIVYEKSVYPMVIHKKDFFGLV